MAEAAGSELETEVDGMPLLGGKGGDGFDNSVPLFIAWDSSAVCQRRCRKPAALDFLGFRINLSDLLIQG